MRYRLFALALAALLASGVVRAAEALVTEVIPLGYRSVGEIAAALRPLVPAPGTVTGLSGQLVIRTDPDTLESLRKVIAELDRAPRDLVISVRRHITDDVSRDLAAAAAAARIGDGGASASVGATVLSTRTEAGDRDLQQIRVLEGSPAFIASGRAVPLADRTVVLTVGGATVSEGVRYVDVTRGFWVRARLSGDGHARVAIAPHRDQLARRGGGAIDRSGLVTEVVAPVGRWIRLGGIDRQREATGTGISASTAAREHTGQSVFLRVEIAR